MGGAKSRARIVRGMTDQNLDHRNDLTNALTPSAERPPRGGRPPRRAAPPVFRLLSELLADVPPQERFFVLAHFEDAVRDGAVSALRARGAKSSRLDVVTPQGKRVRRVVREEIVLDDGAFRAWFARERRASRLAVLAVTGRIETTVKRLESGEEDSARLVAVRRARLARERSSGVAS